MYLEQCAVLDTDFKIVMAHYLTQMINRTDQPIIQLKDSKCPIADEHKSIVHLGKDSPDTSAIQRVDAVA